MHKKINQCFAGIIGQARSVSQLEMSANAYANGGNPLSFFIEGEAGLGKTMLLRSYVQALNVAHEIKTAAKTECVQSLFFTSPHEFRSGESSEWNKLSQGIEHLRPLFLGIDETQDFRERKTVQTDRVFSFIKRALDGNGFDGSGNKTLQFTPEISVNIRRDNFACVTATNYPEKVPDAAAIRSRFSTLKLDLMTNDELTSILLSMLAARDIKANEDTISRIAKCGRGTCRPLERITEWLESHILATNKKTRTVNKEDVALALKTLQLYLCGLNKNEVKILLLCDTAPYRVVGLSQMLGIETKAVSNSVSFLAALGMVGAKGAGVVTSPKGQRYLTTLKEEKFTLPLV